MRIVCQKNNSLEKSRSVSNQGEIIEIERLSILINDYQQKNFINQPNKQFLIEILLIHIQGE